MAILKSFPAKSPAVAAKGVEVIYISDNDSESDGSSDGYEFEDVDIGQAANLTERTEIRCEEAGDDMVDDDEAPNDGGDDDQCDGSVSNAVSPGDGNDYDAWDESDAAVVAPYDHALVNYDQDHTDADGETDDEAVANTNPNNIGQSESDEIDTPSIPHATRCIVAEMAAKIDALNDRVSRLEAKLHASSTTSQAKTPPKKRKRTTSASPRKRQRGNQAVNISAERVCIHWEETSEDWVYSWRRGRGGHCWVRDTEAGREEVDGGYLLCCAATMSIDIRANATWQPITVRFNNEREVFEGLDNIEGRRLEVKDLVLMDMILGVKGKHEGLVSVSGH